MKKKKKKNPRTGRMAVSPFSFRTITSTLPLNSCPIPASDPDSMWVTVTLNNNKCLMYSVCSIEYLSILLL